MPRDDHKDILLQNAKCGTFILDRNSEYVAHALRKKLTRIVTAVDLSKRLNLSFDGVLKTPSFYGEGG